MRTIYDVASELPRMYDEAKKTNNPKTFDQIIKKLFNDYGQKFGYEQFSIFKLVLLKIYNKNKKKAAQAEVFVKKLVPDEEFFVSSKTKYPEEINENSGAIFTAFQVEELGLNEDSY